jgi:ribonuclease P protein component
VGFVVAKKVHNRATKRNLVKRRLREAYKKLCRSGTEFGQANLGQWYAMVFVVHNPALAASYEEICKTVNETVLKAEKKYGQEQK